MKQVYNSYILVIALEVLPVIFFISVMFTLKTTQLNCFRDGFLWLILMKNYKLNAWKILCLLGGGLT